MSKMLLNRLPEATVAVIGDVMIDVYLKGVIERISPEAPVPVVRAQTQYAVPGGAANVAANIAALGAAALLVGVVGEDCADLCHALLDLGVRDHEGLIIDASRRTIRKQRIMAGQQVVRIDFEDTHPLVGDVEAKLIARAFEAIDAADTVILSDYGKGVLTPVVIRAVNARARLRGKPIIVDPKQRDLSYYRGATLMTPNRKELTAATGLPCESDEEAALAVQAGHAAFEGDILLTRSEKGLSYYPRSGRVAHYPTHAREVFDVSGAGDTVIATLATALAVQADVPEAIRIANHAAGIVVGKAGTATASLDELREAMEVSDGHSLSGSQLAPREIAAAMCRQWQRCGLKVGLANGCFDLIHPGHIALIRQASAHCDRLIMALNTDASVRRLKGPSRPVQSETARAEVMGAFKGVDLVVLFDEDTPFELINVLQPDVLIKGSDYTVETVVGADIVLGRGGAVILADLIAGQSTTRLLRESA
jgi:D-beta-D-heptose 7-phosphate kinase/D-beta-D-heptose 1-phosphate adenosyltransferase